jgi:hypothetical protein
MTGKRLLLQRHCFDAICAYVAPTSCHCTKMPFGAVSGAANCMAPDDVMSAVITGGQLLC